MPILEKKAFKRSKPPQDLDPNEELFYCKATHEVFRNYEQFFERVILCNSLVWTCAMTGKSNITFQEAVESEENARISLRTFPQGLKKPVLYLASLTKRSRLNDMCDDVFNYVKDRFFVGEEVEVTINGVKKSCEVTQVVLPDKVAQSPVKNDNKHKQKDTPPSKIKYEVVDYGTGRTATVKSECISRPKSSYTKPRNKLYLKHLTEMKDGVFKVKGSVSSKAQLSEFQFSEVFPGPLPGYAVTEKKEPPVKKNKKIVQGKLNFKKETMDERKQKLEKQALSEKQKVAAEKERQKAKDKMEQEKIKIEERVKLKEEKLKEKEKKREEKKILAEYLNSWKKPRDDLECDDLKDLPVSTPIECGFPQNCFGDAVMILEFLNTFDKQIQLKDVFPHGFTFEHVERALTETDIQGVFNDLLQLLLTAIFRYQEAEMDTVDLKNKELETLDNLSIEQAMDVALITSTWPQKYHGTMLRNFPLDSFSVTEILRLHLLSSGSRPRISWQGVVSPSEDPGLLFKMEEGELLKKLGKCSVFELNCEERCKVLSILTHQLLACDVLHYAIDEYADKTRPLRNQLKEHRQNFARKQREEMGIKKKDPKEKDEQDKEGGAESTATPVNEEEKENSENLTPEEKEALQEKKSKEAARLKAEFQRKDREIESQIRKLQLSFNLAPVGRDRAFRRYWIFQTIAGVFVEDDDSFKGVCLPKPVPQIQNLAAISMKSEASPNNIKKYLQNDTKNGSSDKENEILRDIAIVQSELPFPLKNRKLSDLNPRVDLKKSAHENNQEKETCLQCVVKNEVQDSFTKFCPHLKSVPSDQCTASVETCPVHNINAPRTMWSFYYKEEDLDALINTLNPRGFRERSLKETLINEKERIKEVMSKCIASIFNKTLPPPAEQVRKSQRHQNSLNTSYAGMAPQDALELTLRDMILELEHRIFAGGLGCLKVNDREAWRAAIEVGANRTLGGNEVKEDLSLKDDIESDILKLSLPISTEKIIKDLATAMLQLSQGIELKYLNPPLGESDEQKKSRQKQDDSESQQKQKSSKISTSALERWQESLMKCASMSQLFVHLGTLERSVAWSRSVLRAHCRICRRRGDAENMLLCDGCNRGHHLYCLKPPLKVIPEGDWFCLSCKPVEIPVSPTKKTRKDESESEEAESEEDGELESEEEEAEEESDDSTAASSYVQESCEACGDVGTLLCCDGCPLMYHAECVNLKRIPRGEWLCPKCSKKEEAIKKAQKHPSNGTYGTRSSTLTTDDKKKSNPSIKAKMGTKGVKRKYESSFEEEFEPPAKRSNRDRKSNDYSEKDDNPFKRVYKDSALNVARRRSKTGSDTDMLDYKACIDMLVELMKHPSSWPFLVPVSKKDAPGYHLKIKRPMDFGTIRSNLNYMKYKNNQEFVHDIYLVLHNCWLFNPKSSPEFKAAEVLNKEVKRLLKEYQIADTSPVNGHTQFVNES